MTKPIHTCAIIGAGMTGLLAAHELISAGVQVFVFEQASSAGGRLATRRFARGVFDYGAQFFTAREPRFAEGVARWQAAGYVAVWSYGFPLPDFPGGNGRTAAPQGNLSPEELPPSGGWPRYRGAPGMSAPPKYLAQGARVTLNNRIEAVMEYGAGWMVLPERTEALEVDAVILTPPVPQSLAILADGMVELPADEQLALAAIDYDPCLAVLALLDGPTAVPAPGGLPVGGEPLAWIADNYQKRISPIPGALTLHGGPQFSRAFWDRPDAEVAGELFAAARAWMPGRVKSYQVERWRYSRPAVVYPQRCLVGRQDPPLVIAGDAFGDGDPPRAPRVESAALSGLAAADWLLGRG